ncbi:MAG: hypothetical protein ACI36Y_09435 [Coriobacteriales bacterium]
MEYTEMPGVAFELAERLESRELAEFAQLLAQVGEGVELGWRGPEERTAHPGVALARGTYRIKQGSFVDPFDLSVYGGQYYEANPAAHNDCLHLSDERRAPQGAQLLRTAGELQAALAALLPAPEAPAEEAESAEPAPAAELPRLIAPEPRFEYHGKLTRGWHAELWQSSAEDPTQLLVFWV